MTVTANDTHPVKIDLDIAGQGTVEIDGLDIASKVRALSVEAAEGNLTLVTLQLVDGVSFDGYARVQIADDSGFAEAAELVRSLDAQEMQQAALASGELRMGDGPTVVSVVLELVAKALERAGRG